MLETEQQCRKYFTLWDPDHRIEVAPEKLQAPFANLFDKAVKTTAYAVSDYRTTLDLAARLMEASVTASPAAPSALAPWGHRCNGASHSGGCSV